MDLYKEQLVKRKMDVRNYITMAAVAIAALGVILLSMMLFRYLSFFIFILWAAVIYGAYVLITGQQVEYEYVLSGDSFAVVKIIAQRKRRKMVEVPGGKFEVIAPVSNKEYDNLKVDATILALSGVKDEEPYFATFVLDNQRYKLIFEPDEGMKEALRRANPSKFLR